MEPKRCGAGPAACWFIFILKIIIISPPVAKLLAAVVVAVVVVLVRQPSILSLSSQPPTPTQRRISTRTLPARVLDFPLLDAGERKGDTHNLLSTAPTSVLMVCEGKAKQNFWTKQQQQDRQDDKTVLYILQNMRESVCYVLFPTRALGHTTVREKGVFKSLKSRGLFSSATTPGREKDRLCASHTPSCPDPAWLPFENVGQVHTGLPGPRVVYASNLNVRCAPNT